MANLTHVERPSLSLRGSDHFGRFLIRRSFIIWHGVKVLTVVVFLGELSQLFNHLGTSFDKVLLLVVSHLARAIYAFGLADLSVTFVVGVECNWRHVALDHVSVQQMYERQRP